VSQFRTETGREFQTESDNDNDINNEVEHNANNDANAAAPVAAASVSAAASVGCCEVCLTAPRDNRIALVPCESCASSSSFVTDYRLRCVSSVQ